ncbi:MAG: hypothetical protein AAF228_12570, partial [Pseudomonadota bacterium]
MQIHSIFIFALFKIGYSTGVRWAIIYRKEVRKEALPSGGDRRSAPLEAYCDHILTWLKETPDLTLSELSK